jgi:hypothetical protein
VSAAGSSPTPPTTEAFLTVLYRAADHPIGVAVILAPGAEPRHVVNRLKAAQALDPALAHLDIRPSLSLPDTEVWVGNPGRVEEE